MESHDKNNEYYDKWFNPSINNYNNKILNSYPKYKTNHALKHFAYFKPIV